MWLHHQTTIREDDSTLVEQFPKQLYNDRIYSCVERTVDSLTVIHRQKRHRLDASCGFYRPDASCQKVVPSLLTSSSSMRNCEHQTYCNLIFADLLQVDKTTCIRPACSSQLAASLLTTCNRLVIIMSEQAMRPHPDIDSRLAATCAFLAGITLLHRGFLAG